MFIARSNGRNDEFSELDLMSMSPSPRRVYAADTAKGIAILFVVLGHAWRGVSGAGLLQDEALFARVDALIYAWHMPLFFFLSGLHFLTTVQKEPAGPFVLSRITRLLWPMVLWSWIFFGFKMAAGGAANTPVQAADFPIIPLPPYEHLWFLWALFLVQLIVMVLAQAARPVLGAVGLRQGLALLAVGLAGVLLVVHIPSVLFGLAIVHLPYFLAGAAVGRLSEIRPPPWLFLGAVMGVAALLYAVTLGVSGVPLSLGLVLLLWVVIAFMDLEKPDPGPVIAALRLLGKASMAIYLTHTIFSAALRISLVEMGVTSVPLHVVLTAAVGVVCPLAVLWAAERFGIKKYLGL